MTDRIVNHYPILDALIYYQIDLNLISLVDGFFQMVPDTMRRETSSTGKYHKDWKGRVPSTLDHTLEMLTALSAILRSLCQGEEKGLKKYQLLMIGCALHDGIKYGSPPNHHTSSKHAELAANLAYKLSEGNLFFENKTQREALFAIIALHEGPWSYLKKDDLYKKWYVYPWNLVHIVDMMSSGGALRNLTISESVDPIGHTNCPIPYHTSFGVYHSESGVYHDNSGESGVYHEVIDRVERTLEIIDPNFKDQPLNKSDPSTNGLY